MSNWVQKDAAELLAISPRVMNYKIKTLNIEMPRRDGCRPSRRAQFGVAAPATGQADDLAAYGVFTTP